MEQLKKWIDRKEIFAIKGPRQSGKTTLLKILHAWLIKEKKINTENIIFITFEEQDILEKFSLNAKDYVNSFIKNKPKERFYFFIDEFQYLENGGQILKTLYDLFDNVKFIITGSSSLELIGKTAKFLVGRIFYFYLWQLSFEEFVKLKSSQLYNVYKEQSVKLNDFIFESKNYSCLEKDIFSNDFEKLFQEYAIWGGYPAVAMASDNETKNIILKNIYNTYINKEIVDLLKITDYGKLKTLVAILSSQIGNLVNYNNLANDTQSYFKEIQRFLSVLEETYIIFLLKPFFTNKVSELKKNPKVYLIDIGLRNYIISGINKDNFNFQPDLGAIIENVVFSQLRFKQEDLCSLKYWRTLGKAEVDFILETPKETIPIEVKYSNFTFPKISRGFRSFIQEHAPKKAIILTKNYFGEDKINSTIIKFVPVWYL
ncbi:ATP-binding protein [Patescibacteria group bacterium]|nr:ATP-binding protein [Patescibacteria group bacterium]MBU1246506.1 ATP-binding protein [Patescibacteria group bacterium]MBU1519700.1 ATP-binding protein [Patescibacteria group bacterium]MBU2416810.1 ATP-binding protein [Patescibacteria group bacterium]MBU2461190.1 ATP-binding protein [Patescibacteria group bacterium]